MAVKIVLLIDFLKVLKPKLAIASAGFNNRYGHPSREVQKRLQALNIPLLNTTRNRVGEFSCLSMAKLR